MEYCKGYTLYQYLRRKETLPEGKAREIIVQVVAGLKYLNEQNPKIIHMDIKPGKFFWPISHASVYVGRLTIG